ncbi:phosphatidylinositol 3-kinase, partial [Metschnikowia bicuspidata var. bicuspidata NRRL YB-4993]
AVTIGLSKDLTIPITVRLRRLHTDTPPGLAAGSARYKDAAVLQRLSAVSRNSPMFVAVQLFDGSHNAMCEPRQTAYTAFHRNTREWDCCVRLPVLYSQAPLDAYLRFTVLEMVCTRVAEVGRGHLSLFDPAARTLRGGAYRVAVVAGGGLPVDPGAAARLLRPEHGGSGREAWLDRWAVASGNVDSMPHPSAPQYHLVLELPNLLLPVVFLDVSYGAPLAQPQPSLIHDAPQDDGANKATVLRALEVPAALVYDPDFHSASIASASSAREQPGTAGGTAAASCGAPRLDGPIERKFHSLAININNNSMLDKEAKPSPHMRDELARILLRPSSGVLHDHEKTLVWKFRYYFSSPGAPDEQASAPAPLQPTRQFFTKFLKCFNWENEYELDHAFREIVPLWGVDRIDIGDALELLSDNFNPRTLTAALRRRLIATTHANGRDINTAEETKIDKIFMYTKRLRHFAVARLRVASADELLLYLLQLVQALKYEPVLADDDVLDEAPLARFLIERAVANPKLGNYFYWYVKVENEDQLNRGHPWAPDALLGQPPGGASIYNIVLNLYIENLKAHSLKHKLPHYKHLKSQIAFIKKLTAIVELLRSSFRKNEPTPKKVQFLRDYLADSSNGMLKFSDPFPLPLDPSVVVCGCYPQECSVFKSSMAPLKITFKTITNFGSESAGSASFFGARKQYGRYPLMFKIGDDLRQDQLVIQIINLMDQLLKNENLNLKLTPYKILATSPIAGLIQFIPNETLDLVLSKNYAETESASGRDSRSRGSAESTTKNGILTYLQLHSRLKERDDVDEGSILGVKKDALANKSPQKAIVTDLGVSSKVMDNYVKSCAGYCVITYILGVGDRHLDNLLLSPNGKFWHADFGYILGRDPKPFPPMMKLPIQVIDGMGGMSHENFNIFKSYCFITYTTLRRNSNLILNLFQLMLNANIPDIQIDPKRAVEKVQDKFALEMTEEEAILHFQNLIIDSVNAFLPVVIDTLHSLAQYWRA